MKNWLFVFFASILISCESGGNTFSKMNFNKNTSTHSPIFVLGVFHDPGIYETWKSLRFHLGIKNVSAKEQSFSYYHPYFWYPVMVDTTQKKKFYIQGEVYDGGVYAVKVTLKPNETFWIDSSPIVELEGSDSTGFKDPSATPGTYTIQCQAHIKWQNKDTTLLSDPRKITIEPGKK